MKIQLNIRLLATDAIIDVKAEMSTLTPAVLMHRYENSPRDPREAISCQLSSINAHQVGSRVGERLLTSPSKFMFNPSVIIAKIPLPPLLDRDSESINGSDLIVGNFFLLPVLRKTSPRVRDNIFGLV